MKLTPTISVLISAACTLACSEYVPGSGHAPYPMGEGGTVWTVSATAAAAGTGSGGEGGADGVPDCLSCREALAIEGDGEPIELLRLCDNAAKSRDRWEAYKLCACGELCPDCAKGTCMLSDIEPACALCAKTQCQALHDDCVRDGKSDTTTGGGEGVPITGYVAYSCTVPPCPTESGYMFGFPKCGETGWWGTCEQVTPTSCGAHFEEAKVLQCN